MGKIDLWAFDQIMGNRKCDFCGDVIIKGTGKTIETYEPKDACDECVRELGE